MFEPCTTNLYFMLVVLYHGHISVVVKSEARILAGDSIQVLVVGKHSTESSIIQARLQKLMFRLQPVPQCM